MRNEISVLGVKKVLLYMFLVVFFTSCSLEKASQETETSPVAQNQNTTTENIASEEVTAPQEKILLTTSIVPLAAVVNTIGGDYVEVSNIVPAGVSPHGFDLSAKQMTTISDSEKVFMVGLEHIDGFLNTAVSEDKQVYLANDIELIEVEGHNHHDEHGDEHSEEEDHHDDHSSDPHVWLGKENITKIAIQVRDELSTILPEQTEYFTNNTENFISELNSLYAEFVSETSGKTPKEFIVFHDAYNYLMQSVGMDMNLKVPFSENILHEAGTAHMAELIEEVELHGIQYIFSEPQFTSGNIEQFAQEYQLTLGILDPLGTNPSAGGYLENLENNLKSLAKIYE